MVGLRLILRLLGVVTTLVLGRLLTPDAFGIVSVAATTAAVMEGLTDLSFTEALVRTRDIGRHHYDTAWTLVVLRGVALALLMVFAAPLMAGFMREPRLEAPMLVLGLAIILQSLENPRLVDFHRELNFDRLFQFQLFGKLFHFAATISLAFLLQSYWALILSLALTKAVTSLASYALKPWRPSFRLSASRDLLGFSKWLMIGNVVWIVDLNSITFLLGRIAGLNAVGLYEISRQIASLPASEIAVPIRAPVYAAWARLLDQPDALRQSFVTGLSTLLMLVVPMAVGIYVLSDPVTTLLLGSKWSGAAALIRIVVLASIFDAIKQFAYNLFIVIGHQRRFLALYAAVLVFRTPLLIYLSIIAGATGAAYAILIGNVAVALLLIGAIFPILDLRLADLLRPIWRSVVAALAMGFGVSFLRAMWTGTDVGVVTLAGQTLGFVGCGLLIQLIVQGGLWIISGRPQDPEGRAAAVVQHFWRRVVLDGNRKSS
jgi:lipopolysaccharide exporter